RTAPVRARRTNPDLPAQRRTELRARTGSAYPSRIRPTACEFRPGSLSLLPQVPFSTQTLQQFLAATEVPRIERVQRPHAHLLLDLRERVAFQLPAHQFPAPPSHFF